MISEKSYRINSVESKSSFSWEQLNEMSNLLMNEIRFDESLSYLAAEGLGYSIDLGEVYEADITDKDRKDAKKVTDKIEKFRLSLEEMEKDFKHIFFTKNGSEYFVLPDGHCFRLKKFTGDLDGWGLQSIQPITDKVFFVNQEQGNKARELNSQGSVWTVDADEMNEFTEGEWTTDIQHQPIAVGLHPLEINFSTHPTKLELKITDNSFKFTGELRRGKRVEDLDFCAFSGALHLGHEITTITKGGKL